MHVQFVFPPLACIPAVESAVMQAVALSATLLRSSIGALYAWVLLLCAKGHAVHPRADTHSVYSSLLRSVHFAAATVYT